MPFKKGKSGNPKGKPPGTKNKVGAELRQFLAGVLDDNKDKFSDTLKGLSKGEFVKLYLETLQFTLPKLKQIEHREVPDIEAFIAMSPEEKAATIRSIKEQLNEHGKDKS